MLIAALQVGLSTLVILALSVIFIGVGLLAVSAAVPRQKIGNGTDISFLVLVFAPWLGILTVVLLGQAWYLLWPVNSFFWSCIVALGVTGWVVFFRFRTFVPQIARIGSRRFVAGVAATGILVVVWLSFLLRNPMEYPDFLGLSNSPNSKYGYLHAIQLIEDRPMILGGGHLSPRLGGWSASWLLATAGGGSILGRISHAFVNPTLVCLAVVATVISLLYWHARRDMISRALVVASAVALLLVVGRVSLNPDWWLVAPVPEIATLILILWSAIFLWVGLAAQSNLMLFYAALLAAGATAFRLTTFPWFLLVIAVIAFITLRPLGSLNSRPKLRLGTRVWLLGTFLIVGLVVIPVVIRVGLTSFPFYPIRWSPVPGLPWVVPDTGQAEGLRFFFSRNFQIADEQLASGGWYLPFFRYLLLSDTVVQTSLLTLLLALIWFAAAIYRDSFGLREFFFPTLTLVLISFVSLFVWLQFSVVERYAWPYFLSVGLFPMAYVLTFCRLNRARASILLVGAAAGAAILVLAMPTLRARLGNVGFSKSLRISPLGEKPIERSWAGVEKSPEFLYVTKEIGGALRVDVPLASASCGAGDAMCVYPVDLTRLSYSETAGRDQFQIASVTG